jgi:cell wall assembly regulator SMI1
MSILNSISSFWDDLTTSRRHAAKKSPIRSTSPSQLPFYSNGHPHSASTNNLPSSRPGTSPFPSQYLTPPGLSPLKTTTRRQGSWEAPTPSIRSTSTTVLQIPSSSFLPSNQRKPSSGIQLQELSPNGVQPPPPVVDSWARIDAWAESHYPELFDQLCYPATSQDVDDLETELDCTLPMDVRQSLYAHDGQDRGGKPTGILFGVTLLDCEEIVEEWQLWKTVAQAYVHETNEPIITPVPSPSTSNETHNKNQQNRRQSKIFGLTSRFANCRPPDTIQKVYAHPAWIPLAKDFSGNNIAVDLCPGPRGTWGQIILFGRDCDTKYVVARSWASFLAAIAEDFEGGEARFESDGNFLEDSRGELRIRKCQGARDDTFLEVLKGRVRLREREIRRRRETMMQKANAVNGGKDGKSPTVDLMANSPILAGDGIPSPNLPRNSDSVAGSPVIGTPQSVTISGRDILAKEKEQQRAKKNRLVIGGVVLEDDQENVLATPILVAKSVVGSTEDQQKASTGLGIDEGGVGVVDRDIT